MEGVTQLKFLSDLIRKWILAKKFRIPNIQFTDHMKLKKEDQSVDASVLGSGWVGEQGGGGYYRELSG